MEILHIGLIVTTLLCALVAGLVFAFAVVVMPGLGTMNDRAFLHAFQRIDRVIQNNQPLFMVVWVGSLLAMVGLCLAGVWQLAGTERLLLVLATAVYLGGVQLPTMAINIPLNNQVQALDIETLDDQTVAAARARFEARWVRWNTIRTVLACVTVTLLLVVLWRL